jgi:hypothetical protein
MILGIAADGDWALGVTLPRAQYTSQMNNSRLGKADELVISEESDLSHVTHFTGTQGKS